jgi:hypothetical protein
MRREEEIQRAVTAYEAAVAAADQEDEEASAQQAIAPPLTPIAPVPALPLAAVRGPRPIFTAHAKIDDYTDSELVSLVAWIQSDGRLRSDEEITEEMVKELGFKRRGPNIARTVRWAIDTWRAQHKS